MFMATLGMKTNAYIRGFVAAKVASAENGSNEFVVDSRGRKTPSNKKDHASIHEHILSYNPQISHYRVADVPNRRYLESHLTITDMMNDYNLKHENHVSFPVYYRAFSEENISFMKPNQDVCDMCEKIKGHTSDCSQQQGCKECAQATQHKIKAERAREEYQKANKTAEQDEDVAVFTADMQKVVLLPKLTTKEHFFVSRLVVFNETFASLSPTPFK